MAKKKAKSSPQKRGNPKTKSKRLALDEDTSEAQLQAAIERQKKIMEAGEVEPPDFNHPIETLLDVPNRKPLADPGPEVTSYNGLIRFVIDTPQLYKKFISLLLEGATLGSAVASSKFCNVLRVKEWLSQGIQDAYEEKDTYFSRLYYDVSGANGEKRAQVEIQVAEDDPKFWLERGPGKYLDNEWQRQIAPRALPNGSVEVEKIEGEGVLKIEHTQVASNDEVEGEVLGKAPVTDDQYAKALKALQEAGVNPDSSSEQAEGWVRACKIQSGEQLSEEELEVKEDDDSPISLGSNEELLTEQQRQAQSSQPW